MRSRRSVRACVVSSLGLGLLIMPSAADEPAATPTAQPSPGAGAHESPSPALLRLAGRAAEQRGEHGDARLGETSLRACDAEIYADEYHDNKVNLQFTFFPVNPFWVTFSLSPTQCDYVDPTVMLATGGPLYYYASTDYHPCEDEGAQVTVVATPQVGDTQSRIVCLRPRIDISGCQSYEMCVETVDAATQNPERAYVEVSVIPSNCGSVDPIEGWSEADPNGRYLFCSTYTAGACDGRVRVKFLTANDPPYSDSTFYFSFDQTGGGSPPSNDACSAAIAVGDGSFTGSNVCATTDGSVRDTCAYSGDLGAADVWWKYTPVGTGTATIDTCASDFDTILSVHSSGAGCPGTSSNQLECNDDACGDIGRQSHVEVGVSVDETYYVRVAGWGGETGNIVLNIVGPPPCDSPAAPSNLDATAVSCTGIDLTWQDNSSDEDEFVIYRSRTGGNYTEVATVPSGTTSYQDRGLSTCARYWYKVSARRDSDCESDLSEPDNDRTFCPPDAAFTANDTTGCEPFTVSFTDQSTENPTSWTWDFGDQTPTSPDQNPDHIYNDSGTYTVSLTATNACGQDTETKIDYITVGAPVAAFTANPTSVCAGQEVQFIDESTRNPTSWEWDFGDQTPTSPDQNPDHTYNDSGTYTVSLTATNECGGDTETKINYITVSEAPPAPTSVEATDGVYCDIVHVSWDEASGATEYNVYRAADDTPCPEPPIATTSATSYDDEPPADGMIYYYSVKASNDCGDSTCSATDSGYSRGVPLPPTGVTASDADDCNQVQVCWDAVGDATEYKVFRSTSDDPCPSEPLTTVFAPETCYADSPPEAGTPYYYWVKAGNDCGDSECSNTDAGSRRSVPPAPKVVSAAGLCGAVRVTWSDVSDRTSFCVYRDTADDFADANSILCETTSTSYDDANVQDGTTYYYWVTAWNVCGEGEPAGPAAGSPTETPTWCHDADEDSYGDPNDVVVDCDRPAGYVSQCDDCDDSDDSVYPGADEGCDRKDTDCDGVIPTYETDDDGDGFAECEGDCDDSDDSVYPGADEGCDRKDTDCDAVIPTNETDDDGDGFAECEGDCDDDDNTVYPGADERCDGVDNNCVDGIDEPGAMGCTPYYRDEDRDGYGVDGDTQCLCVPEAPYDATQGGDCDDNDPTINPGSATITRQPSDVAACEGDDATFSIAASGNGTLHYRWYVNDLPIVIDSDTLVLRNVTPADDGARITCEVTDDCGTTESEPATLTVVPLTTWCPDGDGDGYGDPNDAVEDCNQPSGYVADCTDCNDDDNTVYPGADELCDGQLNNCDGELPADELDDDFDGVINCQDNCPGDFNPAQDDDDGDLVGNECDTCPDTPGCATVDSSGCPSDADADGIFDECDNCPDDANPGQEDCNGDGVGNACDPPLVLDCPSVGVIDKQVEIPATADHPEGANFDIPFPEALDPICDVFVTCEGGPLGPVVFYPVGDTTVKCEARDARNRTDVLAECSFTVRVTGSYVGPPQPRPSARSVPLCGACGATGPATFGLMLAGMALMSRGSARRADRRR